MTSFAALLLAALSPSAVPGEMSLDIFQNGEAISLDGVIPANERGIVCLATDDRGRVFGGTTGRAAHWFVYDPATTQLRSLARLEGGIGFAYQLVRLPDGSFIGGTQADPTGVALRTDPQAVGRLYCFTLNEDGTAKVESLGVPVPGQGICSLAYLQKADQIVGNTWPDGHFFVYDLKTKSTVDHGALAGHRTFLTPPHAEDVSRGLERKVRYPRQVSRAIWAAPTGEAITGGAGGLLFVYHPATGNVQKLDVRLPATPGRESWSSLDAVCTMQTRAALGATSDGYLFELNLVGDAHVARVTCLGKPIAHGNIRLLTLSSPSNQGTGPLEFKACGVAGALEGMPRSFRCCGHLAPTGSPGLRVESVEPGGIPRVNGQLSMVGWEAMTRDPEGNVYAGERDRIARLLRFRRQREASAAKPRRAGKERTPVSEPPATVEEPPARLDCHVVFAPQGTTTDGSGYTAIEVGRDGNVYVGAARYGDYAWLLRFDPARRPLFMQPVVNLQQLSGERLEGINTQGKIHAKILVGADGRIWFASKQGHEVFDTRPEYGEDPAGYPGGHLCYFDPVTGFSRSVGILKKQEGVVGGAADNGRGILYYRSEPKNHLLSYDINTGQVQDRGHVGASCRYMAINRRGAVYTVGRGETLCCYDPQSGYVEDWTVRVQGPGGYTPPYVVVLSPGGKLYGMAAGHASIMEFDVDKPELGLFPSVSMRNVAPAAPAGLPVQDIHAAVFGKDGKLYYPLNTSGPLPGHSKPEPHLRIMCFDPETGRTRTIGIPNVVGLDEEKVKHVYTRGDKYRLDHMQGAAVGADGSLYLMDIYPQLNVACFPKLTADKAKTDNEP